MKDNTILLIIIVAIFYSCQKDKTIIDKKVNTEIGNITKTINSKLRTWKDYTSELINEFNTDSIKLIMTANISFSIIREFSHDNHKFEKEYFYQYSPDSSKIVDIHSYSVILDSADGQVKASFDVDSEALLYDVTKRKSYRLLFYGPTAVLDDAAWIDDSTFIIVGFTEHITDQVQNSTLYNPTIWYFDLSGMTLKIYKSISVVDKSRLHYFKIKFPEFVM